jgi:transcriptional regulator with XRE-family HTH domain
MGINIGLLIWKEMKVKSMSREQLADEVQISKHRVGTILKSTSIDTDILTRISIALDVNFFEYFRKDEDLAKIEMASGPKHNQEIADLKRLNSDKNKLLELYEETIKSQKKIIASLENLAKP